MAVIQCSDFSADFCKLNEELWILGSCYLRTNCLEIRHMTKRLLFLASTILLVGCSHTIKYKLTDQDRWTGPKLNQTIWVGSFTDQTTPETRKEVDIAKDRWRTNYRSGYANSNLTADISAMIAKHLVYSGLFKSVVTGDSSAADCTLSGNLSEYWSIGRVHSEAEATVATMAGFGLVGAIISSTGTASAKTEIRVSVKLNDIKLTGKSGQLLWQDSISVQTNFPAHFREAEKSMVFNHTDNALKVAVTEIIRRIGSTLATNQVSLGN